MTAVLFRDHTVSNTLLSTYGMRMNISDNDLYLSAIDLNSER